MPKTILAVDDEESLLRLYERALSDRGYMITLANGTTRARALMGANSYDLLITDLMLGDGSGTELIELAAAGNGKTKCILITGSVKHCEMPLFAEKYGLKGFFEKPFSIEALQGLVKEILQEPA
ncbi:MAG: hypothetical protein A2X35_07520 [Elusimicrobia bacterium GWA2_61_42]|nr:MAG: hypothetical protein A2X35_07520 [Elusimicrobia bacterium GWA2_61_42]OGR77926.1 MAG: hypothetical protein A2X38_10550 [Elusimicrobia bacterium GWC2_61_25]